MASRFTEEIDGEGVAWGAAGFVVSLLIGVAIEPFRGTVGLENVALGYLLVVVVAAAVGGRAAGLISALSAALSYDFFLTTPYHSLRIDSVAQVITVALLFGTGLVASLAGRARRRQTVEADTQVGIIRLLNTITRASAAGENSDRLAAEGIYALLDAHRVVIQRGLPDREVVVADIGEAEAPVDGDGDGLSQLDAEGHLLDGRLRSAKGSVVRWVRPSQGAVLQLVQHWQPVGRLIVTFRRGQWIPPVIRLALATVAHALATATGPAVSHDQ
jgi:K+-sensing histidine kinase KdpD